MTDDPSRNETHFDWDRLSSLFEAAMSVPPARRRAYIASLHANEPELARELAELTGVAEGADAYFSSLDARVVAPVFAEALAAVSGDTPTVSSDPDPPLHVRHFEVHECLGSGGMGVVYRGWDAKLARDVALKFLHPERLVDSQSRARLLHEAQAASSLSHANVCSIHAVEDLDDGGLCIVMGYCAGGTLQDRLQHGALPVEQALAIAQQVADGLAAAHRNGIVHRDIKPANIGFDTDGNVRILDFGIARRVQIGSVGLLDESMPISPAGSLPYLAPEQLRGAEADARCDIWSLGVTLHEMLSGERPFNSRDRHTLTREILHAPLPSLVRADGEPIPDAIARALHAMLDRDPNQRPATGDALLAMLKQRHAATAHTAHTEASSPSPPVTRTRGPLRARTVIGLLAAAGAALVVIGLRSSVQDATDDQRAVESRALEVARSDTPLPTLAVMPFSVEGSAELAYLEHGLIDLLTPAFDATGLVRAIDPNAVIGAAASVIGRRIDANTARTLATSLGAGRFVTGSVVAAGSTAVVRATLHRTSGDESGRAQITVHDLTELASSVDHLVHQLVASELLAPGDTIAGLATATTPSAAALRSYLDGERELRDARPAAALVHFERAIAEDSLFALAWYRLARAARWSDVDSLHAQATQRAFTLVGSLPLRLRTVVRGYHELQFGHPVETERLLRKSAADYPTDVDSWMLLGETLFHQNPYYGRSSDEALEPFRRVMTLDPRNREVNVHLMDLAARGDRVGELDTLFRMYFDPNSAGEQPGIRQTYIALHARRVGSSGNADTNRLDGTRPIRNPDAARIALQRLLADPRDIRVARGFAEVLASSASSDPRQRLEGLLALATLDAVEGFADSAMTRWSQANAIDSDVTLMHRVLVALSPVALADSANAARVRAELRQASGATFGGNHPASSAVVGADVGPYGHLSTIERSQMQQYAIGLLSLRMGDNRGLNAAERSLAQATSRSRVAVPLAASLRGHRALARGDYEQARVDFGNSAVHVPFSVRLGTPLLEQHADRLAHAVVHERLRAWDEATRWYASLLDGPALSASPYHAAARAGLHTIARQRTTVQAKR